MDTASPCQCDPCERLDLSYRDSMSWRKAVLVLLCRLINVISGGSDSSSEAYFAPLVEKTAAAITGSFTQAVDLLSGTRIVILDNQTDGDVVVSMDSGNSSHYYLRSYQTQTIALPTGLVTTADIYVKDGTVASTSGSFYIYAVK